MCESTQRTKRRMRPRRLTNAPLPGLRSCGQVGHLAENCSSTERLCFNCGKGGHESSACPDPRTAEQKSCYLCLGKGHIKVSRLVLRVLSPVHC